MDNMEVTEMTLDTLSSYSDLYFYRPIHDSDTVLMAICKTDDFTFYDTIDRIAHYLKTTIYKE